MTSETQRSTDDLSIHPVVSRDDWIPARKALDEIAQGKVYYNYDVSPITMDELGLACSIAIRPVLFSTPIPFTPEVVSWSVACTAISTTYRRVATRRDRDIT